MVCVDGMSRDFKVVAIREVDFKAQNPTQTSFLWRKGAWDSRSPMKAMLRDRLPPGVDKYPARSADEID